MVKFDQNLTQLATYATSFNVYDYKYAYGDIIAGSTGSSELRTQHVQVIYNP